MKLLPIVALLLISAFSCKNFEGVNLKKTRPVLKTEAERQVEQQVQQDKEKKERVKELRKQSVTKLESEYHASKTVREQKLIIRLISNKRDKKEIDTTKQILINIFQTVPENDSILVAILDALGKVKVKEAIADMISLSEDSKNPKVIKAIIKSMGNIASPEAIPFLKNGESIKKFREEAEIALEVMVIAVSGQMKKARNSDELIFTVGLDTLKQIDSDFSIEAIATVIEDRSLNEEIRLEALEILITIGPKVKRTLNILVKIVMNEGELNDVVIRVTDFVEELTGKSIEKLIEIVKVQKANSKS